MSFRLIFQHVVRIKDAAVYLGKRMLFKEEHIHDILALREWSLFCLCLQLGKQTVCKVC